MNPPWKEYPDYPSGSLAWRMGDGEDYLDRWWAWLRALTLEEQQSYKTAEPAPESWQPFYESL